MMIWLLLSRPFYACDCFGIWHNVCNSNALYGSVFDVCVWVHDNMYSCGECILNSLHFIGKAASAAKNAMTTVNRRQRCTIMFGWKGRLKCPAHQTELKRFHKVPSTAPLFYLFICSISCVHILLCSLPADFRLKNYLISVFFFIFICFFFSFILSAHFECARAIWILIVFFLFPFFFTYSVLDVLNSVYTKRCLRLAIYID